MPWMSCLIKDLIHELHRLSRDSISSCIHCQPSSLCSLIDTWSHKKSCISLANVLQLCKLQLIKGGPEMVADVVVALLPFLDVSAMSNGEVLCPILNFEFGTVIVDQITQHFHSPKELRRLCGKSRHSTFKRETVVVSNTVHHHCKLAWPSVVPQNVVLCCLGEYHTASQWLEPPMCTICSMPAMDCLVIHISNDLVGYNLDLL